jgi:potassium intermediate/small conductance calcium-activated channel subfamily N protein 3
MNKNFINNWIFGIRKKFILKLIIELFICSIHPIPGDFHFYWKKSNEFNIAYVSVDEVLSVPMFFRVYLIWRVYLLYSNIFDLKFRIVAALNSIKFSERFIFKILMNFYPMRCLLIFNLLFFLSASWILRLFERLFPKRKINFFNHFAFLLVKIK